MKRLICILLITAMSLSVVPMSFASAAGRVTAVSDFSTDTHECIADESHELTFTARIATNNGGRANPCVYDDNGRRVTRLYDDATHGDETADDGIYTATIDTGISALRTVSYHVEADGIKSAEQEVIFYHMMTARELVLHEKFWADAESYRQNLRDAGYSPEQILSAMYDYVKASDVIDASTLEYSDAHCFTFCFTFGTAGCIYEYTAADTQERAFDATGLLPLEEIESASWEDPDFMVFRPFRQSPNSGNFDNEFYTDIARDVCEVTGGEMHDYQELEAFPGNLVNIDNYGFFFIDSHGVEKNGKSFMMMRKGDVSAYDYAADLSAGHIIASGADVGVTGSFFTKYLKDGGRQMPGTLLCLVICFGMSTDSICDPALDCGAQLVFGYTDSVSFRWDFELSATLWEYLLTIHPDHPERTYTFIEALNAATAINGGVDPYSVGNEPQDRGVAKPRLKGNTDFVICYNGFAPVESFSITNKEISLYTAETAAVEYEAGGDGALRYELAFSSDNESIASVDENGVITMQGEGRATITATLTDISDTYHPVQFTDTCEVTGLGYLAADGIYLGGDYIEIYESADGRVIDAHVLPENATDKVLHYVSADERIAVVSEDGIITPVSVGHTMITITHPDTEDVAVLDCRVLPLTLSAAVNAAGGDVALQVSPSYPFVPAFGEDGTICAKSSNHNVDSSLSWIKVDGEQMQAGSTFSFEWRVSSEKKYDMLIFYVNDEKIESISDETDWARVTYTTPEDGRYTFRITYMKDNQLSSGEDTGYIRNMELHRLGERHTVYFYDMDGQTLLASVETDHGGAVTPPEAPEHAGFSFYRWNRNTDRVLSDLHVTALYDWCGTYGDVNNDGRISTADATYVLKVSADMLSLSGEQIYAADVSHDGTVDTLDAVYILKYVVGNIAVF